MELFRVYGGIPCGWALGDVEGNAVKGPALALRCHHASLALGMGVWAIVARARLGVRVGAGAGWRWRWRWRT